MPFWPFSLGHALPLTKSKVWCVARRRTDRPSSGVPFCAGAASDPAFPAAFKRRAERPISRVHLHFLIMARPSIQDAALEQFGVAASQFALAAGCACVTTAATQRRDPGATHQGGHPIAPSPNCSTNAAFRSPTLPSPASAGFTSRAGDLKASDANHDRRTIRPVLRTPQRLRLRPHPRPHPSQVTRVRHAGRRAVESVLDTTPWPSSPTGGPRIGRIQFANSEDS
jgi:hypothetical protein